METTLPGQMLQTARTHCEERRAGDALLLTSHAPHYTTLHYTRIPDALVLERRADLWGNVNKAGANPRHHRPASSTG